MKSSEYVNYMKYDGHGRCSRSSVCEKVALSECALDGNSVANVVFFMEHGILVFGFCLLGLVEVG